jgi:hypothetical protein
MLGKMLRRTFLPFSSDNDREFRSDLTSVNSGALLPLDGRFPEVLTGLPFIVIFAIAFFSKIVKLFNSGSAIIERPPFYSPHRGEKFLDITSIQLNDENFLPLGGDATKWQRGFIRKIQISSVISILQL